MVRTPTDVAKTKLHHNTVQLGKRASCCTRLPPAYVQSVAGRMDAETSTGDHVAGQLGVGLAGGLGPRGGACRKGREQVAARLNWQGKLAQQVRFAQATHLLYCSCSWRCVTKFQALYLLALACHVPVLYKAYYKAYLQKRVWPVWQGRSAAEAQLHSRFRAAAGATAAGR